MAVVNIDSHLVKTMKQQAATKLKGKYTKSTIIRPLPLHVTLDRRYKLTFITDIEEQNIVKNLLELEVTNIGVSTAAAAVSQLPQPQPTTEPVGGIADFLSMQK
jgi:hypothetical protein